MGRSVAWEDIVGAPETDPTVAKRAREMFDLERRVSQADSPQDVSVGDRERIVRAAYIALPRGPDWKGTRKQMMQILDKLKQEACYNFDKDYAKMHGEQFVNYFEKVYRGIGGDVISYCPEIGVEIRAKNREAQKTSA